jgi:hypothetical protein
MFSIAASLRNAQVERVVYDPSNEAHNDSLDTYLVSGNWGKIQFFPELPFSEVPITVLTKYARYMRDVRAETKDERKKLMALRDIVQAQEPESAPEKAARLKRASDMITA